MDEKYWAHGPLTATVSDLQMSAAGVEVGGNLKLRSELRFNPKLKTNLVQDLVITLRDLAMRAGHRSVNNWWLNVESKRLAWRDGKPARFDGSLSIQARDLEPVLEALAEKDAIPELIPMFTRLGDFRANAIVHSAGPITDVTLASESDVWDAAGRIHKNGERSRMAIVVGGQAVSLGIANDGSGLELMPFAKTGWLNEHLREFPKPLVEMRGAAP
jgi:hypothetical protein